MNSTLAPWFALSQVRGVGRKRQASVAAALFAEHTSGQALIGASSDRLIQLTLSPTLATAAAAALDHVAEPSVPDWLTVITPDDEAYPLSALSDDLPPPVILYALGNVSLLGGDNIAVAGSRHAAEEVLEYTRAMSRALAKAHVTVVTGHAAGVDKAAEDAALDEGGGIVSVLAEGLTEKAAREVASLPDLDVLLVSEFPVGVAWSPRTAMQRNSTIAALARAVVVVAAGESGGSLAQGELCLKEGKRLFVPDFEPSVAPGNALLLKQGAELIDHANPESILEKLAEVDEEPSQTLF